MTTWIRNREHHEETTYHLFFQLKGHSPGTGKAFDCDSLGFSLKLEHVARLVELRADEAYAAPVVEAREHRWTTPAAIRCGCGGEVELDRFTNTCERCGLDYNMSGDRLAAREQWGEETGEHWSDILQADAGCDCGSCHDHNADEAY